MRILILLTACMLTPVPVAANDLIPVEHFAKLPLVYDEPKLSPDGKHYAATLGVQGELVLAVISTDNSSEPKFVKYSQYRPRDFRWAGNDHIIFSITFPARRGGTETLESRLATMDIKSGKVANLIEYARWKPSDRRSLVSQFQDDLLTILPNDHEHVLIALDKEEFGFPGIYKVDIDGGIPARVERQRSSVASWAADASGAVRFGQGYRTDSMGYDRDEIRMVFRENGTDDFKSIELYKTKDALGDGFGFAGFTENPTDILIYEQNDEDRRAVFRYDTQQGKIVETVFSHPKYDVSGVQFVAGTDRLKSVSYVADSLQFEFFDEEAKSLHEALPSVFPGLSSHVVSTSDDRTKFVVEVEDTSTPPAYYIIDLQRGLNVPLGAAYPELENVKLSETRTVTYVARDGLEIPAYLTIPAGSKAKNLPLIVHPHGGPWSRDSMRYNYWVQFFVSRGWAVLQPNFRGSDGYGVKFLRAGHREWGLTMQDDVTDGVKWAVDRGIADPAKICIVGGSYGGYAAVQGLVKTPDLYKCGVGLNGVYDLAERLADGRYYTSYRTLRELLPNEGLSAISPSENAEKIQVPVLIAYGTKDRVVDYDQSTIMISALKRAKKDVTKVKLEDGDHYLTREENRIAFFKAMDKFLQEHLGLGPIPAGPAAALVSP